MTPSSHPGPRTLIVGLGRRDRGDDGLGPVAVDLLGDLACEQVELRTFGEDLTPLLDAWAGVGLTIVIDAVRSPQPLGGVRRWEWGKDPLPALPRTTSTHALSLPQLLPLGQALARLPDRLVVLGLEAQWAGPGEGLSPSVKSDLPELLRRVREEVRLGVAPQVASRSTPAPPTVGPEVPVSHA